MENGYKEILIGRINSQLIYFMNRIKQIGGKHICLTKQILILQL